MLSQGATAFESTANGAAVSADQKGQLLTIALEYARAAKDNAAATRIAQSLTGAEPPAAPNTPATPVGNLNAVPSAPAAGSAQANRRIQLALVALGNKDYAGALKQINEAPEVFTEAAEQVEALYCIAEAKNGTAKDTEALKDAALDYMRVVARAKAASIRSPRVPDALYKTAVIHERIRANDEAVLLYQQVTTEYPDDANVTPKATAALQRLEKKE
jgi:TolA-binding protein